MTWQLVTLVVLLVLQAQVFLLLWAILVKRPNWLLEEQMKHRLLQPREILPPLSEAVREAKEDDTLVFPRGDTEAQPA